MPQDSQPAAAPASDLPLSQPPTPPGLLELFVAFAKMSLAGFGGVLVWPRRGIVDQHRWMTAEEFNETFALCHFLPGPNIVNLSVVFGSRFGGLAGGLGAFAAPSRPPSLSAVLRRHADVVGLFRRHGRAAPAATSGAAGRRPAQLVHHLVPAHASDHMNATGQFWTLVWAFASMSFFAVGGANSAIPEMHRLAVDVHHWMNDKEFADMFAISQLSPGPNGLIVTLLV